MNEIISRSSILAFIFLLLMTSTGCAHYSRGPWAGKVIDAETKEPIEGAAVVAVWHEDFAAGPGSGDEFVDAVETLTDNKGSFEITSKSYFPMLPRGEIYGPQFTIYKPGYKVVQHTEYGEHVDESRLHFYPKDWKGLFEKPGDIVGLTKLKTREERIKNLPGKSTPGVDAPHYDSIEEFIRLMNGESIELGLKPY
jgi:hypothetical protein